MSWELIARDLQEIVNGDSLVEKITNGETPRIYWGTAPTGDIHIGYFIPLMKIKDFVEAGANVTILIADLHAALDANKTDWENISIRSQFYEETIRNMLLCIDVDISKITFKRGSEYQLTPAYNLDLLKLMSKTTLRNAQKAGAEVVKQSKSPLLSELVYPLMQALDEEYLKVDAQFGGIDQRKIFMFAHENLPKIGYSVRAHLMNPMLPGIHGSKMSASDVNSKISINDTPKQIRKKINKCFCEEGDVSNGLFVFIKHVLFPLNNIFIINDIEYQSYEELCTAFENKKIHPRDVKNYVADKLIALIEKFLNI